MGLCMVPLRGAAVPGDGQGKEGICTVTHLLIPSGMAGEHPASLGLPVAARTGCPRVQVLRASQLLLGLF